MIHIFGAVPFSEEQTYSAGNTFTGKELAGLALPQKYRGKIPFFHPDV